MKVGFLGLGQMGSGVARNLANAGCELTVWNRSAKAAEPLISEGARRAEQPADALQGEVAFSMFDRDETVQATLIDTGALDRAKPGLVHVNLATVSPAFAEEMTEAHAARGLDYVAAPVFGRPDAAAAGKLHVLCAGASDAVAKVKPLLERIGQSLWPLGETPAHANLVKLSGNFALAAMIEMLGEIGALAQGWGLEPKAVYEVLTGTLFAAPAYKTYADIVGERRFEPAAFKLPLGLKDVRLVLAAGESRRVPLPTASLLRDQLIDALAAGDGEKDWAALGLVAARHAGQV